MARGKHATKAANRRLDASHDHIDRLTDQLADAKARARQVERDAARLPAVEAEVARLRAQIADATSDDLERERERRRADLVVFNARLIEIGKLIRRASERRKAETGVELRWTSEEFAGLRQNLGPEAYLEVFGSEDRSRTFRRNAVKPARRNLSHMRSVAPAGEYAYEGHLSTVGGHAASGPAAGVTLPPPLVIEDGDAT